MGERWVLTAPIYCKRSEYSGDNRNLVAEKAIEREKGMDVVGIGCATVGSQSRI